MLTGLLICGFIFVVVADVTLNSSSLSAFCVTLLRGVSWETTGFGFLISCLISGIASFLVIVFTSLLAIFLSTGVLSGKDDVPSLLIFCTSFMDIAFSTSTRLILLAGSGSDGSVSLISSLIAVFVSPAGFICVKYSSATKTTATKPKAPIVIIFFKPFLCSR